MPHLNSKSGDALRHWGEAFDAIPKAAFAVVAWHLANVLSGSCDTPGAAARRFLEEAEALEANGILPAAHLKAIKRALAIGGAPITGAPDAPH